MILYHINFVILCLSSWIDRRTLKHCDGSMIVLLGCIWRRKQLLEDVFMLWVPHATTCFKQNWWHIYINGLQAVNLFEISGTQCVLPCIAEVYDITSCLFSGQFKEVYIYVDKIKFHVHVALPKLHLLLGLHPRKFDMEPESATGKWDSFSKPSIFRFHVEPLRGV